MTIRERSIEEYTKALARMMMFWLCQTRSDLQRELANGIKFDTRNEWKKLPFTEDIGSVAFNRIADHYRDGKTLSNFAKGTHARADNDWQYKEKISKRCPSNLVINAMYTCAKTAITELVDGDIRPGAMGDNLLEFTEEFIQVITDELAG